MTKIEPVHCTYCDTVSQWSAEHTERTELSEDHVCPSCEVSTSVWDDTDTQRLDRGDLMPWLAAEPVY